MPQHDSTQATVTQQQVARAVAVAAGREPADLLLRNARIVNVITMETCPGSVAVAGPLIAGAGPAFNDSEAITSVDLEGRALSPGLIDGHLHIESSLVTPAAYAEAVAPRGVTSLIWDPHEIANVSGDAGLQWCIRSASGAPMNIWIGLPSCVPSTTLETAGAVLGVDELARLLDNPAVIGVGELMSYPAVIAGDRATLAKAFLGDRHRKVVDGHCPGITGRALNAYFASGVGSDHESTELEEAREKLRAGAFLMIREGSATRNLAALLPLLTPATADRIGFVTDDRLPTDLLREGGVDDLVRKAITAGVAPELAIRAASWNTARYFGLARRGAVAPGYFADLVVFSDLEGFRALDVYRNGELIARNGVLQTRFDPQSGDADAAASAVMNSVKLPDLTIEHLRTPAPVKESEVRCIQPVANQILTREVRLKPTVRDGSIIADPDRDIARLVCVERHGKHGRIGVGLVTGLGIRRGAIAGTVAHDHHNVLAAGISDHDILTAVRRLGELGGGFVVAADGTVIAELALPIAGLLSQRPLAEVESLMRDVDRAAAGLGVSIPAPFMTLSFLGLPVIPELRLTDHGLVDVCAGAVVPLAVEPS
ncbi:MAG: adenine deaminase [Spirochaetaceae bacterium]|nr:MAG: adenine deaminase [Spirochaetaceae bacterium]